MHESAGLEDILSRELATYRDLLSLAARHQDALVRRDTEALHEIARRHTPLLAQAARLDEEAREALQTLACRLGVDPAGATVSSVIAVLDPESAARLGAVRDEIAGAVSQLAEANWVNARLLGSAMDAARFSVQLITGALAAPDNGYPAAETPRRPPSVLLDQRV